jgi:uncharacterized cupin superfamily protein
MVREARLERTDQGGLVPRGDGWYILNAREAPWENGEELGGYFTRFEGDVRFPHYGFNVNVLAPGQVACMYHGEEGQEDFLVVAGECLAIVEGEERTLRTWDLVHCPPWTEHVFVGAGDGPCVIIGAGARNAGDGIVYPANETARRHGAAVERDTSEPHEAYARYARPEPVRYPGLLP